jgi:hypothetical protein
MTSTQRSWAKAFMFAAAIGSSFNPAWAQSGQTAPQPATEADALAIYQARLATQQANNEANMAAASASYKEGLTGAKEEVLEDQLKMVASAVKNWKAPRTYARSHSIDSSVVQDPFAAPKPSEPNTTEMRAAIDKSGLGWDNERQLARVTSAGAELCGGRLLVGDYPTLPDGNLLDSPARITQFLATCADRSSPLMVVVESGDIVVRK